MPPFFAALFWGGLVLLGLYLAFFRDSKKSEFTNKFYGPPQLPILGSLWELVGNRVERTTKFFFKWPQKYGPRFTVRLLNRHLFFSIKHDDIEKILSSQTQIHKGDFYDFLGPLVYGLVGLGGEKWAKRRKMVNPSFHFGILKGFQTTYDEQSKILVSLWKKQFADGTTFDMCPYISRCTLDVICETAMGTKIGAQFDPTHKFLVAVDGAMRLIQARVIKPWLHPNLIWDNSSPGKQLKDHTDYLKNFRDEIIANKRKELRAKALKEAQNGVANGHVVEDDDTFMTKKKNVAFLDLILAARDDEGNGLSDDDVGYEVDTFITAGQDTTAHATAWCCFLLALNPKEQEKVIEELDEIFGDDTERSITNEDLTKMKYLEYCVKESMRIRPSVPAIFRTLVEDLVLSDGTVVPAGVNFIVHILALHNDPEYYPEPEIFKPERFVPELVKERHFYSYVPFSSGPRYCIGHKYALLEEKTLIANILRNFRLETKQKLEEIPLTIDITMRPTDGLMINLKPRH